MRISLGSRARSASRRRLLSPVCIAGVNQQALCAKTSAPTLKAVKQKRASDDIRRIDAYEMELARGVLHIASMLYEETIHAAVSETALLFEASRGRDDLKAFAQGRWSWKTWCDG